MLKCIYSHWGEGNNNVMSWEEIEYRIEYNTLVADLQHVHAYGPRGCAWGRGVWPPLAGARGRGVPVRAV